MEGPTPVSALIHAATMVTAGVYLIARTHPLFELAPTAADVGAIIGCATLVFAGTVALAVTDLKRVIAYSTISQIGYMVMGVSMAAYGAGLFHLMTHAFFKALLFMGAGSVIGAMAGIQDMDRMGGFRRAMPFTFITFTIGALALAGFPLTAGFFSKDEILAFAINRGDLVRGAGDLRLRRRLPHGVLRVPDGVPRVLGDAGAEARELEGGHLAHGDPVNPMTGEPEDTDVGFPGPGAPRGRARVADEGGDGSARAALDRRRVRRGPGRDRRDREVPRADLRGLALPRQRAQRRRRVSASRSAA